MNCLGQVLINFRLIHESDYIVFHSKNLTIVEKVSFEEKIVIYIYYSYFVTLICFICDLSVEQRVVNADNHEIVYEVSRMLEYSAGQQILLEFDDKLSAENNYTLIIKYTTRLSRELEGFYLSSYTTSKGERR